MPNLMCNVSKCEYNESNACCREGIQVAGYEALSSSATACDSFSEKSGSFTNSYQSPNASLDVSCKARNCTFNESGYCDAETISIAGHSATSVADTECSSFVPKF